MTNCNKPGKRLDSRADERHRLESQTRYDPAEAEPRVAARWERVGPLPSGARGHAGRELLDRDPAAERDRRPAHGPRAQQHDAGRADPPQPHARAAHEVDPRHRPRRHRHADPGREGAAAEGTSREEIGREAFVERTWEWTRLYGGTIVEQLKRLGASLDYEDERFTLDEGYAEAVLKVFVDLYEKGLIYRDNYLVNWDPGSRSAISDLEVEEREVTDTLYYVDYPLASGHGSLTIATVRPETMLADTAIAVHPDDERYTRLVGETAILPLVGRRLTIIADDYVKPEFGTGALKITPGHDSNDFEIGRKHGLEEISAIGEDGRMTAAAGEYEGMTALEAREAVVAALRAEGRIARTEPYVHNVPFSHRSGERIEPLISLQWFMRMDELAARALEPVRDGRAADQARGPAAPLRRVAGEHPPLVRVAPAVVGPPDPRLLPRRGDLRGPRAARGRGLGARPGRARHLVLEPAVAVRDARLAG